MIPKYLKKNLNNEKFLAATRIDDCHNVLLESLQESVGSTIKSAASQLCQSYHDLEIKQKAIAMLGLNSIVDLSFTFPGGRSTLFNNKQWEQSRKMLRPRKSNTTEYRSDPPGSPLFTINGLQRTPFENIYSQLRCFNNEYDAELDVKFIENDTDKNDNDGSTEKPFLFLP